MSVDAFGQFREAFVAGDAVRLAEAFTPDGSYAANVGILLQGRDQIRMGAAGWFARRPSGAVVDLDIAALRSGESDGFRWELLEYRQHGFVLDQPAVGGIDESGYALVVYERENHDGWRIQSLVVNLRAPASG